MGDEASALIFDDEDGEDGSGKEAYKAEVKGARGKGDGSFASFFFRKVEKKLAGEE